MARMRNPYATVTVVKVEAIGDTTLQLTFTAEGSEWQVRSWGRHPDGVNVVRNYPVEEFRDETEARARYDERVREATIRAAAAALIGRGE
jgi:hypothetical protein